MLSYRACARWREERVRRSAISAGRTARRWLFRLAGILAIVPPAMAMLPLAVHAEAAAPAAADSPLVYIVIVFVLLGTIVGIASIRQALMNSSWSLADALSEEAEVTFEENVDGVSTPKFDDNAKPLMVTELRASSSRLIALLGLIVIMMMFIGFGVFTLRSFANGQGVPEGLDSVLKFLLAGMTMFAPYAVNKFASMFDWMKPK